MSTTEVTITSDDDIQVSGEADIDVNTGGVELSGGLEIKGVGAIIDVIEAVAGAVTDILGAMNGATESSQQYTGESGVVAGGWDGKELVFKVANPKVRIRLVTKKKTVVVFLGKKVVLPAGKYESKGSVLKFVAA